MLLEHLGLRSKLALLAGIPVLGAVLLSTMVISGARESARTAEAIGSIEDLAELSDRMHDVVSALQAERARTAWVTGQALPANQALQKEQAATDASLARLQGFVDARDEAKLPPRLARELGKARTQLAKLPEFRKKTATGSVGLDAQLDFYAEPNLSLIAATSALTELSDDGALLRNITTLASAMEVKERQSQEHALLAHVFALKEFPPGMFRRLVTLDTEEQVYQASFARSAADQHRALLTVANSSPASKTATALKKQTLELITEEVNFSATQWFEARAKQLGDLENVERDLSAQVRSAAAAKVAAAQSAVRLGLSLTSAVLLGSLFLAVLIAVGLARSIQALLNATEKVRVDQDFSIRVQRRSHDEIGKLADAFNEMLSGIQDRDTELAQHRAGLERLVDERTRELRDRNAAMRLVLDNVAQGLATAGPDGTLSAERSAAFDRWFGPPPPDVHFASHVAGKDARLVDTFSVGFEQVLDDILPIEVSLEMMPKRLERDGRHFSVEYAPLMREGRLDGLLLMITDVTARVHAERAEADQREQVKAFQSVLNDRTGFIEFFADGRDRVEKIRDDLFDDDVERRREVHTLKGNASLFGLETIVAAAHDLEQAFDDTPQDVDAKRKALVDVWDAFAARTVPLLGEDLGDRVELSKTELEAVLQLIRRGVGMKEVEKEISRLAFEPMRLRLNRIRSQLLSLAKRLGKPEPRVVVNDGGVRLPTANFAPVWNSISHLVRNIVDHALDEPSARVRVGKPPIATVELVASQTPSSVTLSLSDDGRGIDWDRVQEKAKEKGLPHATANDLSAALLSPNFSTATTVTQTSGRGVGLSVVAAAVTAVGGTLTIESQKGRGTRFTLSFHHTDSLRDSVSPRLNARPLSQPPPGGPTSQGAKRFGRK